MPNISLPRYLSGGAKFIVMLHEPDVIHADIRPENMALEEQLHVRLVDFSEYSLCGARASRLESTSFYLPRGRGAAGKLNCSITTELFALGTSFYQMLTSFPLWYGVPTLLKMLHVVTPTRKIKV